MSKPLLVENPGVMEFLTVAFHLPEDERRQFEAFTGYQYDPEPTAVGLYLQPGVKWGFLAEDGAPVAVGGYRPIGPGVFDSFMLVTTRGWEEYGKVVTMHAIRAIKTMFRVHKARRLQTLSLADRTEAHSWYKKIGLQYESTLARYCANGTDAVMYVKVKDDVRR